MTSTPAEPTPEALGQVIGSLLGAAQHDDAAAFARVAAQPEVAAALEQVSQNDVDGFAMALLYPFEQTVRGLVDAAIPGSPPAQFLLGQANFIAHQFEGVLEKHEGRACVVDKTRFLLDSLLAFFRFGHEVTFDRTQRYTYHLPQKVFQTHGEVLTFFDAVQRLYYGRSAPFVQALADIDARMAG